jgi:hypothetical protein
MKKSVMPVILTFATILLVTATNAQKIGVYDSKWYSGASADDEEGMINRMQFEEKSQFLFLIANDEKNLYVDLILADKAGVQKIMRYGLTTWFNPEGKHKKAMGIQFPVTSEGKSEPAFMRDKGGDRKEMRMAMMASKNEEMVLIGFGAKGEQKVIDPRIDSSFHGKVEMMEGGKLHVSLVIPLEKLGRGNTEKVIFPISAGFETGYMDLTRQGTTGGGSQGGGGGESHGGGMQGGGGMPGGGPPQGGAQGSQFSSSDQQQKQPDISELASPSKLWISQIKLAEK